MAKKWNNFMYVRAYELAKQGLKGRNLAHALGIDYNTLVRWSDTNPAFADAIARAQGKSEDTVTNFKEYVYKHLSPDLQDLWDKINACEEDPSQRCRVNALLQQQGKHVKQQLFIHALICSNFNATEACRKVGISVFSMRRWIDEEPDFRDLLEEIHWHKKNFFEAGLVRLIEEGDSAATIFANRTVNRDRGYNDKHEVSITGKVEHTLQIDELDLPLEVRKIILEAYRRLKEGKASPAAALPYRPEEVEIPHRVVSEQISPLSDPIAS